MDRENLLDQERRNSQLGNAELEDADERSSPSAKVVHEAIRLEGYEELERPWSSVGWSGLAAGLTMGFSMLAQGVVRSHLPDAPWRDLVAGLGYCTGFVFVTMARQQLFTETTLTVMLPFLHGSHRLSAVLRYWSIVFLANIAGTLLFAAAATIPLLFDEPTRTAFSELGQAAVAGGFWPTLIKGIVAGWLIALMVWLLPAAGPARFPVIVTVTYLIAIAHLSHVIAGSAEVAFAAYQGAIGVHAYLFGFLLPALIGNAIGGVVLVALLNHAQVREEV